MELVLNKQLNGIELYFKEIPSNAIRSILKEHKFRWHNAKKCWYAKKTDETMQIAEELNTGNIKEIVGTAPEKAPEKALENELGIKVGDIFYMSWGYEQTNVDFFRVKELRGKTQIVIQEVNLAMIEEDGISGMSADRKYCGQNYSLVKNSCFVKDNEKGMVKKVLGNKENPYLNMTSYANAYKYDGQKLYESWYY